MDADIFCIQETKLQEGQISLELEGYDQYWNYAVKKGYSGTAVFTKRKPLFFLILPTAFSNTVLRNAPGGQGGFPLSLLAAPQEDCHV